MFLSIFSTFSQFSISKIALTLSLDGTFAEKFIFLLSTRGDFEECQTIFYEIKKETLTVIVSAQCQCTDKLILETILQDKFFYFKTEEGGVAVATATDDNAEIRNLDARLFQKSTCWYTSFVTHFCIQKGHLPKSASVPTIFF